VARRPLVPAGRPWAFFSSTRHAKPRRWPVAFSAART